MGVPFRWLILVSIGAAMGSTAGASDGVTEINQSCAVNTGCFTADGAGYPITITTAGSYRLTSNLNQTSAHNGMIAVTAHGVTIDLNGFEMAGLVTCTGEGRFVSCTGGLGTAAIHAAGWNRLRVQNGRIRNVAASAVMIIAGGRAMIRNVIGSSGGVIVDAGEGSIVLDSTAYQTTSSGFQIEPGSLVMRCVSVSNKLHGFHAISTLFSGQGGSLFIDNTAYDNGEDGVSASSGSVVRGSTTSSNFDDGISASAGSLVSDNVTYENGRDGIYASGGDGIAVQRNTARLNGRAGILTGSTQVAYRENTLNENTAGAISVNAALNMGANSCNGTTTCP